MQERDRRVWGTQVYKISYGLPSELRRAKISVSKLFISQHHITKPKGLSSAWLTFSVQVHPTPPQRKKRRLCAIVDLKLLINQANPVGYRLHRQV